MFATEALLSRFCLILARLAQLVEHVAFTKAHHQQWYHAVAGSSPALGDNLFATRARAPRIKVGGP